MENLTIIIVNGFTYMHWGSRGVYYKNEYVIDDLWKAKKWKQLLVL